MNWIKEVGDAPTEASAVAVVNAYLVDFLKGEIAGLPKDCLPTYVVDADDVHRWHFKLATVYCQAGLPWKDVLRFQDLVVFFLSASARLGELAERPLHEHTAPDGNSRRAR